jgi:RNA polymerase sigma factor (sigma-70 family)
MNAGDVLANERLTAQDERILLIELAECRRELTGLNTKSLASTCQFVPEVIRNSLQTAHHSNAGDRLKRPMPAEVRFRYFELRNRLALGNIGLVSFAAKRYRNRGIGYHDLMQEGFCGLLEAIDRFDPANGNRLGAYAIWWIRQRMQRAVAFGAFPVRLNRRCLRVLAEYARERATRRSERSCSAVEPEQDIDPYVIAATRKVASLDETRDCCFHAVGAACTPGGGSDSDLDVEKLQQLIGTLRPREQEVLALRFGLGGGEQHSLSEAGERLGVSMERVRQIQENALNRLRDRLASHEIASLPRRDSSQAGRAGQRTLCRRRQSLRVSTRCRVGE